MWDFYLRQFKKPWLFLPGYIRDCMLLVLPIVSRLLQFVLGSPTRIPWDVDFLSFSRLLFLQQSWKWNMTISETSKSSWPGPYRSTSMIMGRKSGHMSHIVSLLLGKDRFSQQKKTLCLFKVIFVTTYHRIHPHYWGVFCVFSNHRFQQI